MRHVLSEGEVAGYGITFPSALVTEYYVIFGLVFVTAPLVGFLVWSLFVIARYIALLPDVFTIPFRPMDQGRCAGMKPLGDICLKMTSPELATGVLISLLYLSGLVERPIPQIESAILALIPLLILVPAATFLLPVRKIHGLMRKKRDRYNEEMVSSEARLLLKAQQLIRAADWDREAHREFHDQKAVHETVFPKGVQFPTWPFNLNMRISNAKAGCSARHTAGWRSWPWNRPASKSVAGQHC